jgi:hypothetical protein
MQNQRPTFSIQFKARNRNPSAQRSKFAAGVQRLAADRDFFSGIASRVHTLVVPDSK